jgi:hypothetical protein
MFAAEPRLATKFNIWIDEDLQMKKLFLVGGALFSFNIYAHATVLTGVSCQPINSTEYLVTATASGTLSSAATLTIGSNSSLIGDITESNTKIEYIGTIDCEDATVQIVDGSTTYSRDNPSND